MQCIACTANKWALKFCLSCEQIFYSVWLHTVSQPCSNGAYEAVWRQKKHISGNTVVWLLNCCFSAHDFIFHSIIFRSPFFVRLQTVTLKKVDAIISSIKQKNICSGEKWTCWQTEIDGPLRPCCSYKRTLVFSFFCWVAWLASGTMWAAADWGLDWSQTVITPEPFSARIRKVSLNQTKQKIV